MRREALFPQCAQDSTLASVSSASESLPQLKACDLQSHTGSLPIAGVDPVTRPAAWLQPQWRNEVPRTVTQIHTWRPQRGPGGAKSAKERREPLGGRLFLGFRQSCTVARVFIYLFIFSKQGEKRVDDRYTNTSPWYAGAETKVPFSTLTSLFETKEESVKDDLVVGKQTDKSQSFHCDKRILLPGQNAATLCCISIFHALLSAEAK